jgi:hypothetical protein
MRPTKSLGKDGSASLEGGRVKNTTSFSVSIESPSLPSTRIFLVGISWPDSLKSSETFSIRCKQNVRAARCVGYSDRQSQLAPRGHIFFFWC